LKTHTHRDGVRIPVKNNKPARCMVATGQKKKKKTISSKKKSSSSKRENQVRGEKKMHLTRGVLTPPS